MLENGKNNQLVSYWKNFGNFCKSRRNGHLLLHASSDDGVTVNGSPQASTSSDVEEMRVKLYQSLQGNDYNDGLVQSLHDAARVFELAIKEKGSVSKLSWLSTAWLGVDRNAWIKTLSYQVCQQNFENFCYITVHFLIVCRQYMHGSHFVSNII